jgi:succinate dehydrogenase / fumarate reductase cytochrome b subunit
MVAFIFYGECECVKCAMSSCIFTIFLIALSYAGTYHFLNGIRHLFWDIGYGFSIETVNKTGLLVIILSILITISFWWSVL